MSATSAVFPFPNPVLHISIKPPNLPSVYYTPLRNPSFQTLKFVASSGQRNPNGGKVGEESRGGEKPPARLELRWRDVLDPDPENIAAVGFAGLLAWASLNVLWQLFLVSAAILLAAVKYSFIAALLLFILITLL